MNPADLHTYLRLTFWLDMPRHYGLAWQLLDCVLLWLPLLDQIFDPVHRTDFLAFLRTCLVTTNSTGDLDSRLTAAAITVSILLASLRTGPWAGKDLALPTLSHLAPSSLFLCCFQTGKFDRGNQEGL